MNPETFSVADPRVGAQKAVGLKIARVFTTAGVDPFSTVTWERRKAEIKGEGGKTVFVMDDVEVPTTWSQLALDIAADKYFRKAGVPKTGTEKSVRQMISRVVLGIRQAGERQEGYFASPEDAQAFSDELTYMLLHQYAAFNSPVWFSCGLAEAYGITGKPSGNFIWDHELGRTREADDMYTRPALSACFIISIKDDLMDIARHVEREMRVFRGGGGAGSNFSALRAEGESLSNGGTSSGLMSWLEIFDKSAGATKSGGTTRRAAKLVCLDVDHPDVEKFVEWKPKEEDKAYALIRSGYPSDFNGEAYKTVSGQQANNSVRVTDEFMQAVLNKGDWNTIWRTTGKVARTLKADKLFRKIAEAAHRCADPGLMFDTAINKWNPVINTARITAANPCVEFHFIGDTACNLSSVNLVKFMKPEKGKRGYALDTDKFQHACRIFTLAKEIIVDHASYPTEAIAQNSHEFRPLGLGYANLGTAIMIQGLAYDSPKGRSFAAAMNAIMCGTAYVTSAEIAGVKGPFSGFAHNREPMLKVIGMHRAAAFTLSSYDYPELARVARSSWDEALRLGEKHGFRNGQVTVTAPTGTIALMMDCDTTGIEPEFMLVKGKKMAGGGYLTIVNQSVATALATLGYDEKQVTEILTYVNGTRSLGLDGAHFSPVHVNDTSLRLKGVSSAVREKIAVALKGVSDLRQAFDKSVIGEAALAALGMTEKTAQPGFGFLEALGFTKVQIDEASAVICGRHTVEGAPYLKAEHLSVFDCANRCGKTGKRSIEPMGHIKMLEAVQPFVSGSISKTVNCPNETTVEEIENLYMEAWKRGLKCIAIYRDGSKHSQPLNQAGDTKTDTKTEALKDPKVESKKADGIQAAVRTGEAPKPVARHRLPYTRPPGGVNQELVIGGMKVYVRTGNYANGKPGEIFVDLNKQGSTLRGVMSCFAIAVSLGLQHGVPIEEIISTFRNHRFEPLGLVVGHPNVKLASSIIDAIVRVLAVEYLGEEAAEHGPAPKTKEPELANIIASVEKAMEVAALPPATNGNGHGNGASNGKAGHIEGGLCTRCGGLLQRMGACFTCLNCATPTGCS